MQEFVTVSSSSYDPASLATKLNEKSGEGWTVVAIVPTGGDVTAFLSRESSGETDSYDDTSPVAEAAPAAAIAADVSAPEPDPTPEPEVVATEPVSEPAGWAVAPEPTPEPEPTLAEVAPVAAVATPQAVVEPAPAAAAPAAAATPSVPAGWYADPAGRFELRYWDGGTWTEHVSRGGQQYTDAPVA